MHHYDRLGILGNGSFGVALLVKERSEVKSGSAPSREQRLRVIKEIDISKMSPDAQAEAMAEVNVLRSMSHQNIIGYIEAFKENAKLHIVMEFADGGDFAAAVKQRRKESRSYEEVEVVSMFTQSCLALRHIHARHVVHRDLKCQNIFLTKTGVVKLGDFGISKVLEHTSAQAITQIGSPTYMSPEVCENLPYGIKADMWSIGVVLYELMALERPFSGQSIASLFYKILASEPAPLPAAYSNEIKEVVSLLLRKSPDERPSATEVLELPVFSAQVAALSGHHGDNGFSNYQNQDENTTCSRENDISEFPETASDTKGLSSPSKPPRLPFSNALDALIRRQHRPTKQDALLVAADLRYSPPHLAPEVLGTGSPREGPSVEIDQPKLLQLSSSHQQGHQAEDLFDDSWSVDSAYPKEIESEQTLLPSSIKNGKHVEFMRRHCDPSTSDVLGCVTTSPLLSQPIPKVSASDCMDDFALGSDACTDAVSRTRVSETRDLFDDSWSVDTKFCGGDNPEQTLLLEENGRQDTPSKVQHESSPCGNQCQHEDRRYTHDLFWDSVKDRQHFAAVSKSVMQEQESDPQQRQQDPRISELLATRAHSQEVPAISEQSPSSLSQGPSPTAARGVAKTPKYDNERQAYQHTMSEIPTSDSKYVSSEEKNPDGMMQFKNENTKANQEREVTSHTSQKDACLQKVDPAMPQEPHGIAKQNFDLTRRLPPKRKSNERMKEKASLVLVRKGSGSPKRFILEEFTNESRNAPQNASEHLEEVLSKHISVPLDSRKKLMSRNSQHGTYDDVDALIPPWAKNEAEMQSPGRRTPREKAQVSKAAAEEEHRKALANAAAQTRRDRRQVVAKMRELERSNGEVLQMDPS